MVMELEKYHEILRQLNDPELSHSDRAEHVLTIQNDYTNVVSDYEKTQERIKQLEAEKEDLLLANSKYYRQIQAQEESAHDELVPKHEQPITLSDIFD